MPRIGHLIGGQPKAEWHEAPVISPMTPEERKRSMEREGKFDPVNKPAHYNTGGIECIDYIRQVLGLDGFIAYCHGNMIKYQHRYRYKQNPAEDMKKAEWYLKRMNEALAEKYK